MTNQEARHIATDLHRTMMTRGVYHNDAKRAQLDLIDGTWVCWVWEPDYRAGWTVILRDTGSVVRAIRSTREQ